MRNLLLVLILAQFINSIRSQTSTCQANKKCHDGINEYYCRQCQDGTLGQGNSCPNANDPACAGCSATMTTPSHALAQNPNASAPADNVEVESHSTMFNLDPSSCNPWSLISCSYTSPTTNIQVTSQGVISVDTSQLLASTTIQITCNYNADGDTSSFDTTASISVECQASSTTLVPTGTVPTSSVSNLVPTGTVKVGFQPYQSTNSDCPVSTVGADAAGSFVWSSNFESSISANNELVVAAAQQQLRRTITFYFVFRADGGAVHSIQSSLQTVCVEGSFSLSASAFLDIEVQPGLAATYYEALKVSPTIAACAPLGYQAGSASDRDAVPTGLTHLADTTATHFQIKPSDTSQRQTYTFYLWMSLPDSAWKSFGPLNLVVGCRNHLNANLAQDTMTLPQNPIGTPTPNRIQLLVDETNVAVDSSYRLNLFGFTSSIANCAPRIASYTLSTSSSDSTAALTEAVLLPYSFGDSNFLIDLSTASRGLYFFYIWGQDDETRWDNTAVSSIIEVDVVCGSEVLTATAPLQTLVFSLHDSGAAIALNGDLVPLFSTTKPDCPAETFTFFSAPTVAWSDPFFNTVNGDIDEATPAKKRIIIEGTTAGPVSATAAIDLVVCGNEIVEVASAASELIIQNATNMAATTEVLNSTVVEAFFNIDASDNSHPDCLVGTMTLTEDARCSVAYSGALTVSTSPVQLTLPTQNPISHHVVYLCLTSKGQKSAAKKIEAEVCGSEVAVVDPTVEQITKKKLIGSGKDQVITIEFTDYNQTLRSSSDYCSLINHTLVEQAGGGYVPYSGVKAKMLPSFDIEFSTADAGVFYFYVEGQSTSGSTARLKFRVEIYVFMNDAYAQMINTPPFFEHDPAPAKLLQSASPFKALIQLPEVMDAHSNFAGLFISAEGLPYFFASNSSNLTEWQSTQANAPSAFFDYSFSTNAITVTLPSSAQDAWSTKSLQLTLVDEDEASTTSILTLEVEQQVTSEEEDKTEQAQDSSDNKDGGSLLHNLSFSASITKLSKYGELLLEFTEPVKDLALEAIDESLLDLAVEPADYWPEQVEDFDPESLAFTWRPIEMKPASILIRIEWQSPASLSPQVELDTLTLIIKNRTAFFSKESLIALPEKSALLKTKIPRQLKKTSFTESVDSAAKTTKAVMQGASIAAFALNTVLSGFLNLMLGLINSLQLIVHLPAFNVPFPPNAFMVFETLIPLVTFDILEAFEEQVEVVLGWLKSSGSWGQEDEVPQQFQNVGFEVFQPFPNLGSLGVFILLYLIKIIVWCGAEAAQRLARKKHSAVLSLKQQLFFPEILLIFIEGYLDICLVAFLFLSWPSLGGGRNWTAFLLISTPALFFVPGTLVWIGKQPRERFKDQEFQSKWGVLFEDIRTVEVCQRLFFLAFVVRRLVYVGTAFILINYPSMQLVSLNLSNLSILIYQGYFKPIKSPLRNFIEATNESLMCLATFHLMAFTDLVLDKEAQQVYGWSLVGVVALQVIFNFGILLQSFLSYIGGKLAKGCKMLIEKYFPKKSLPPNEPSERKRSGEEAKEEESGSRIYTVEHSEDLEDYIKFKNRVPILPVDTPVKPKQNLTQRPRIYAPSIELTMERFGAMANVRGPPSAYLNLLHASPIETLNRHQAVLEFKPIQISRKKKGVRRKKQKVKPTELVLPFEPVETFGGY